VTISKIEFSKQHRSAEGEKDAKRGLRRANCSAAIE
jgi:hypothetical protein